MRRPAVLVDRDGTLASVDGPADRAGNDVWEDYNNRIRFDPIVPLIGGLWNAIRPGIDKIVVSGRDGAFEWAMRDWFHKYNLVPDAFFMRTPNDRRKDSIVKAEILDTLILPRWDVLFVIDDRPSVVDMWRSRGISVLQVTDPKIIAPIGG